MAMAEKKAPREKKKDDGDLAGDLPGVVPKDVAVMDGKAGVDPTNIAQGSSVKAPEVRPLEPGEDRLRERRFRQTDLPHHFVERRRRPIIGTEPPLPPVPPRFEDYGGIIGRPELDEIRFLAGHLQAKTVKMVNSTALGGGVAEILNRLVPLLNELD